MQFPLMHFITVATHCSVWESKERSCRAHSALPYHLRPRSSPHIPVHLTVHCAASLDACNLYTVDIYIYQRMLCTYYKSCYIE